MLLAFGGVFLSRSEFTGPNLLLAEARSVDGIKGGLCLLALAPGIPSLLETGILSEDCFRGDSFSGSVVVFRTRDVLTTRAAFASS